MQPRRRTRDEVRLAQRGDQLDLNERRRRQRRSAVITSDDDDLVPFVGIDILDAFDRAGAAVDTKEILIVREGVGDAAVLGVRLVGVEGRDGERRARRYHARMVDRLVERGRAIVQIENA